MGVPGLSTWVRECSRRPRSLGRSEAPEENITTLFIDGNSFVHQALRWCPSPQSYIALGDTIRDAATRLRAIAPIVFIFDGALPAWKHPQRCVREKEKAARCDGLLRRLVTGELVGSRMNGSNDATFKECIVDVIPPLSIPVAVDVLKGMNHADVIVEFADGEADLTIAARCRSMPGSAVLATDSDYHIHNLGSNRYILLDTLSFTDDPGSIATAEVWTRKETAAMMGLGSELLLPLVAAMCCCDYVTDPSKLEVFGGGVYPNSKRIRAISQKLKEFGSDVDGALLRAFSAPLDGDDDVGRMVRSVMSVYEGSALGLFAADTSLDHEFRNGAISHKLAEVKYQGLFWCQFFLNDPARQSAWDAGRSVRLWAYAVVLLGKDESERREVREGVRRDGMAVRWEPVIPVDRDILQHLVSPITSSPESYESRRRIYYIATTGTPSPLQSPRKDVTALICATHALAIFLNQQSPKIRLKNFEMLAILCTGIKCLTERDTASASTPTKSAKPSRAMIHLAAQVEAVMTSALYLAQALRLDDICSQHWEALNIEVLCASLRGAKAGNGPLELLRDERQVNLFAACWDTCSTLIDTGVVEVVIDYGAWRADVDGSEKDEVIDTMKEADPLEGAFIEVTRKRRRH